MKHSDHANPWTPQGFDAWAEHYPATRWAAVAPEQDRTGAFIELWQSAGQEQAGSIRTVAITPGLFAEFLPRCFAPARNALQAAGYRVIRTRARSRHGVRAQAEHLEQELGHALAPGERFIWCAHSKGALDALYTLEQSPALRAGCAAAVVVQPAVGISRVVDRWQHAPAGLRERFGRGLIANAYVRDGVREISRERDPIIGDWLAQFAPVVPTLCVATWSIRPTSWVDSYHRTLNELAPGHAHDGQFLLEDQRLPGADLIGLPEIDHAQPVLHGDNLDAGRFWHTLVTLAADQTRQDSNPGHKSSFASGTTSEASGIQ